MDKIIFLVQGSSPEPYEVSFIKRDDNNLSAYCTCPAGQHGIYCKHRFRILDGIDKGIISNNKEDISKVLSWLSGSDVENALKELKVAQENYDKAKKALAVAKKSVASSFLD